MQRLSNRRRRFPRERRTRNRRAREGAADVLWGGILPAKRCCRHRNGESQTKGQAADSPNQSHHCCSFHRPGTYVEAKRWRDRSCAFLDSSSLLRGGALVTSARIKRSAASVTSSTARLN